MIAGVSLEVEINLGVKASPGPVSKKPRPGEPRIVESGVLVCLLLFAVVLLSCAMALLGVKNPSSSPGVAESHRRFF